ncbi:MAG: peptidylprolyl isomerase [Polyangiaceae bacterium]|nr:peptidylprolyl isomerase [Polyangiaceae bacterium]
MKPPHIDRAARRGAPLLIAAALAACGAPPPPAAAPKPVEPATAAAAAPDPGADAAQSEAVELCFATANAKRAKFSGEPEKITVKHILIKYKGAKSAAAEVTRSRAEACLRAIEARDKIRESGDFDAVVGTYSEEAGAASRSGSIGAVTRADLAKPFADAAFELSVNQLSDVVETEFGFHVILRSE